MNFEGEEGNFATQIDDEEGEVCVPLLCLCPFFVCILLLCLCPSFVVNALRFISKVLEPQSYDFLSWGM